MTTDGPRALEAIREVRRHAGDGVPLAVGTVRSGDDVRGCLDAGATAVGLGGSPVSHDGDPAEMRVSCRALATSMGDA